MLKRLYFLAEKEEISREAIFCSSDINSLDGVILKSGTRKVAVLDGTAPHTEDPHFPGAVDEIVNLGESFKLSRLENERAKIIALNEKKSGAYSLAYDMLSLAGEIFSKIRGVFANSIDYNKAEKISSDLAEGKISAFTGEKIVSSFGSRGYIFLPSPADIKVTYISGNGYTERVIMNLTERTARERGILLYRSPSPLLLCNTDAVRLSDSIVSIGEDGLDTSGLIISTPADAKPLLKMHSDTLSLAQEHFTEASMYHQELEKIYRAAMDFDNNEKIFAELSERCLSALRI